MGVAYEQVGESVLLKRPRLGISKSEVSRICEQLGESVGAFRTRPLDHIAFPYVYLVGPRGCGSVDAEGLYGRQKMTTLVRCTRPEASLGSVGRAMRSLAYKGFRRSKGVRTTIPAKDGGGAGDLVPACSANA